MSDELSVGDVLDGLSLWDEHKPQSAEDWIGVAERFIASGDDTTMSSPLFAALVLAVKQRGPRPKECPQRQDSLQHQVRDVMAAAVRMGCYDAHDWMRARWGQR